MKQRRTSEINSILETKFTEKDVLRYISKIRLKALFILDVGSCEGESSFPYVRTGSTIVSLDIDKDCLSRGLKKGKIGKGMAVIGDGRMLPFRDGTFDIVSSRFFLHEFKNSDRYLREMKRVVKSKGQIICVDFCAPNEKVKQFLNRCMLNDEYVLTKKELSSLFCRNGLHIEEDVWFTAKDYANASKLKQCLLKRSLKDVHEIAYIFKMKKERLIIRFRVPVIFIRTFKDKKVPRRKGHDMLPKIL